MMDSIVANFWQSLVSFLATHFYVSPFWWYFIVGIAVIIGSTMLAWYFQFLRPFAGVIFVAVASYLFGYRKSETDRKKHDDR